MVLHFDCDGQTCVREVKSEYTYSQAIPGCLGILEVNIFNFQASETGNCPLGYLQMFIVYAALETFLFLQFCMLFSSIEEINNQIRLLEGTE